MKNNQTCSLKSAVRLELRSQQASTMPEIYQPIAPVPQPEIEILQSYQAAYAFYEEVRLRQAFEQHCQWYQQVAEQHRQELKAMQPDINLFGWFCRGRKR